MVSGTSDSLVSLPPSRRSEIEQFRAMEIVGRAAELAARGKEIILMCVGQPDAPAPSTARAAAIQAIEKGRIGYTPSPGTRELRGRISSYYVDRYGVEVDPERVFVTTGSSAGFVLAFIGGYDAGARIAIPSPGYPAYRNILRSLSMEPVEIATMDEDRWVITPRQLAEMHAKRRLDGLLVANPNNPNGTMMRPDAFAALLETAARLGIRVISDEIYHGLTYGMKETTALGLDDGAFVINSFSKFFCMTGWRVGWMVVPENMIPAILRLQQNLYISAPEVSQIAALAALDGLDEMREVRSGYEQNRELFLRRLPELGFHEIHPIDGAFYAYCNATAHTDDSLQFAARMLEEAGVAVTPGVDFDPQRGNHWLRFSFCGNTETMERGLNRITAWLG